MLDLTPFVEAALNDVYVRAKGVPVHFSPRLFFPAGVYPLRNLLWNGRVGQEGEGPGVTRLVGRPGPVAEATGQGSLLGTTWFAGTQQIIACLPTQAGLVPSARGTTQAGVSRLGRRSCFPGRQSTDAVSGETRDALFGALAQAIHQATRQGTLRVALAVGDVLVEQIADGDHTALHVGGWAYVRFQAVLRSKGLGGTTSGCTTGWTDAPRSATPWFQSPPLAPRLTRQMPGW